MMKIMTLEEVVSHNAQKVSDFMNRTSKNFCIVGNAVMLTDIALLIMCHQVAKNLKAIKEDIRVMKAELILDENEIKVLRERFNKEKVEKES